MSNSFHTSNNQNHFPPVIEHLKDAYKQWILIERNLPKCERFGLGQKIDLLFTDLLDTLQKAAFSPADSKIALLGQAMSTTDSLRFFIQLCWELKLIPLKQFSQIGEKLESMSAWGLADVLINKPVYWEFDQYNYIFMPHKPEN